MKNLTVVYYENPSALEEIKFWEKNMAAKIHSKDIYENNIQYELENETVFCTPIDSPDINAAYLLLKADRKYYKTLIFGKVNSLNLVDIIYFIKNFELCTVR